MGFWLQKKYRSDKKAYSSWACCHFGRYIWNERLYTPAWYSFSQRIKRNSLWKSNINSHKMLSQLLTCWISTPFKRFPLFKVFVIFACAQNTFLQNELLLWALQLSVPIDNCLHRCTLCLSAIKGRWTNSMMMWVQHFLSTDLKCLIRFTSH